MNHTGETIQMGQAGQEYEIASMDAAEQENGAVAADTAEQENGAAAADTAEQENGMAAVGASEQAESVEQALKVLISALHESREYIQYQKIRAKVHEQPQLEERIHAFRRKNYEIQNSTDEWNLYERVDELEREGTEFRKNPLVDEYLSAELGICRLYQKINMEIVKNIDFDLGFAADR